MRDEMRLKEYTYFFTGLLIYKAAVLYLHLSYEQSFGDLLTVFLILGAGFSTIAWLLLKNQAIILSPPSFRNESIVLILLLAWIVAYITWGAVFINQFIPDSWIENKKINSGVIIIRKLLVFVAVPWVVYRSFDFTSEDFGFKNTRVKFFSRKGFTVFTVLSIAVLLFQFFLSNGSRPVREGEFLWKQLSVGLPLCFSWLFIEAGLVEEFFYRIILQSRLTVLLKSPTGGIVITALIFGLSHAPGLYLRGAESEGVNEQLPFLFWSAYTIAYMSVAGIFLGIVWQRTKNVWLVMAIHAMVDLLPNVGGFIKTWNL
ncbi:MAG: CPBP family intramembrane glutamic endopeptidase [Chitinophagaceae bacterium]